MSEDLDHLLEYHYTSSNIEDDIPQDVTHLRVDASVVHIPASGKIRQHRHLLEVHLPKRLRSIGGSAFYHCWALTTISIPPLVTDIGFEAFCGCYSLQEVELSEGLVRIAAGAFSNCRRLRSVRIPRTVRSIYPHAFCYCQSLESIYLPEGLPEITSSCFVDCIALKNVVVPSSVKSIGSFCFARCIHLVSVRLQEGLRKIFSYAFQHCESLTAIHIPSSVTLIEAKAFNDCTQLVSVEVFESNMKDWYTDTFAGCMGLVNLTIPDSATTRGFPYVSVDCLKLREIIPYRYDIVPALRNRFNGRPLHKLCYYQVYDPLDTAVQNIQQEATTIMEDITTHDIVDYLGMTPIHILALSTRPHVSLFKACHVKLPNHIWSKKDLTGSTAMDFLYQNTAAEALQSIHYAVHRSILWNRIHWLGLVQWRQELCNETDRILDITATSERKGFVRAIHSKLVHLEQKEALSLLEIALWKVEVDEVAADAIERYSCRVNCGADIVISNVLPFLGPATINAQSQ